MNRLLTCLVWGLLCVASTTPTSAALVLQWRMNNPTPLDDFVGTNDLVLPGGAANPTHLPTGGVLSSGAYDFDGVDDRFTPTVAATNLGAIAADWTVSFWIKTTDSSSTYTSLYDGTPAVPVLGDATGAIGFGLGVHGGVAAFRHFNGLGSFGGWVHADGTVNVADGVGNYVTFVHHGGVNTVDIYVNGAPDILALPAGDNGGPFPYTFRTIGRSFTFAGGHTGLFTLDDVRIYNSALTAQEISEAFSPPVPEPSTLALLGLGMVGMAIRTRRRRARPMECTASSQLKNVTGR